MNNFAALRMQKNASQVALAKLLGMSQSAYRKYEMGETEPGIQKLIKLADFYNVSIDYLVGRDSGTGFGCLTKNETTIMEIFRQLKTSAQFRVLGFAQSELERENEVDY